MSVQFSEKHDFIINRLMSEIHSVLTGQEIRTFGCLYPESNSYPSFPVLADSICNAAITTLEDPYQSSLYGGDLAIQ